ncbi:MAG: bacillithiol biosynthesis cysteine-adding enzyme BshC [Balneolaceae bacterium]|nr:bacillithiol biosynthesis cysteine-adding enzyme BshC [Balneolaceae bacterium]
MQLKSIPFDRLPFSRLFQAYTSDPSTLEPFYEDHPFNPGCARARAEYLGGREDEGISRGRLGELLEAFNARFDPPQEVRDNIARLGEGEALAVVTGQQLTLYGGPLYTVYKTLTAIHYARRMEERLGRLVVPVFWLADEDHDYDEVRHLTLLDGHEPRRVELPPQPRSRQPVAHRILPPELEETREEARKMLFDTDFSRDLWEGLDRHWSAGSRFDEAFGGWLLSLFGHRGLVLFGSSCEGVKEAGRELMARSVEQADEAREALEVQSARLEEQFHRQVTLYDSNLFRLDGQGGRVKIGREGDRWEAGPGDSWSTEELAQEVRERPESFSPNVFLRPLLQDRLLPTLAYVAGPGEVAYFGQMKGLYRCFGMRMPLILPRLSATLIEPAIDRILGELPFELSEYARRIEDLESDYVDRTEQADIEDLFSSWKKEAEKISRQPTEAVANIDPTLKGAAGKATATFYNELDKLKGKVYRAVKQQEETQLRRIRRIKGELFPGDGAQERTLAAIWYMNKYGTGLWDRLLERLEEEEDDPFNHHKLIYL